MIRIGPTTSLVGHGGSDATMVDLPPQLRTCLRADPATCPAS